MPRPGAVRREGRDASRSARGRGRGARAPVVPAPPPPPRATPFTPDASVLRRAMAETQAAGGTAVNDFLYMSLKLLEPRVGRRMVILLSDGSDVHSVVPMSEVLWKARTGQAMIYWIQLDENKHKSYVSSWRTAEENDVEYKTLIKAVEESGGRIEKIDDIAQLDKAFQIILQELRERSGER